MKDFLDRDPVNPRSVLIGGLVVLLAGLIIILLLFSGGAGVDADTPVYDDGVLKTTISYSGDEPQKVWVQYNIFRQDNLISSTQIGSTFSFVETLTNGNTLSECPVELDAGEYKIFIYISTYAENPKRLAGFIRTIQIA
ncbi:MAG TPA: hypothetical protein O0X63_05195 [Methanocorpusculum sp.]|nr:hypothetical protein [Methanocorpusculum sp.]HJJ41543.1 hypothetical protein [Methanocorpusculum sp.]